MKYLALIFIFVSGCAVTSRVSVIGTRRNVVQQYSDRSELIQEKGSILKYYEIEIPYEYRYGQDEIIDQDILIHAINDNAIEYNGLKYNLDYRDKEFKRYVGVPYRRWWGYPAQVLQVIAIPIDIILLPFRIIFSAGNEMHGP